MSAYAVNKLCRSTLHDPSLRERLRNDPGQAVAEFAGLTDEERRALTAGDVATLCALGAHSFLLGYLARYSLFGLTQAMYAARIRQAGTRP